MKRYPSLWIVAILGGALTTLAVMAGPSWWTNGVLSTNAAEDYAVVNLGQLKNIAFKAYEAFETDFSGFGGAGSTISNLVFSFSNDNNYAVANVGQLKAVAQPFYDRIIEIGYATNYPWTSSMNDDSDFSAANIGLMKNVFSFDPGLDTDGDGLIDINELVQGSDPLYPDTDHDGWRDGLDPDPKSRAWIDWGNPALWTNGTTCISNRYWPAWCRYAMTSGGSNDFAASSYNAASNLPVYHYCIWSVVETNLIGGTNLALWVRVSTSHVGLLYFQLRDAAWNNLVNNFLGSPYNSQYPALINTASLGASGGEILLKVPMSNAPAAANIIHQRLTNAIAIYDSMLYVDADGDGLDDTQEAAIAANPTNDYDEDGLADFWERPWGFDFTKQDEDGNSTPDGEDDFDEDGLSNAQEAEAGTDPQYEDTDEDGLSDGEEVLEYITDPMVADTDHDGWRDGLDPDPKSRAWIDWGNPALWTNGTTCISNRYWPAWCRNAMTYGGSNDFAASSYNAASNLPAYHYCIWSVVDTNLVGGTNLALWARVSTSHVGLLYFQLRDAAWNNLVNNFLGTPYNPQYPTLINTASLGASGGEILLKVPMSNAPAAANIMHQRLTNAIAIYDSMLYMDADGDGLDDTQEAAIAANPTNDYDEDGMADYWENSYGLDFTSADQNGNDTVDGLEDFDGDGLSNAQESAHGANPYLDDTDDDVLPDNWEVQYGLDPTDSSDADLDLDEDGFTNFEEFDEYTDPAVADSHPSGAWYVATNGVDSAIGGGYTNPFATLTNTFALAGSWDRVILLPGIYTGVGNRDVSFGGKSLFVTGVAGHREDTIVNCENAGRAFVADTGEYATIRNLTICNGRAGTGGAVSADGSSLCLISCAFTGNSADQGGAIWSMVPVSIQNSLFVGNWATNEGGAVYGSMIVATNCIFTSNNATKAGAVYVSYELNVSGCRFIENEADDEGGAIYLIPHVNGNNGSVLDGNRFKGNLAYRGGALFLDENNATTTTINRCHFQENEASYMGGAVSASAPCHIGNSLFKSNNASFAAALYASANCMFQNCTVVNNEASYSGSEGAVISKYGSSSLSLENSIFYSNTLPVIYLEEPKDFPLAYINCCLQDGMDLPVRDASNYRAPHFDIDGWHLLSNSPCINAGQNLTGMSSQNDLDGQPRIWGGTVDIGADERGGAEVDTDGDGIIDWWEIYYDMDPLDPEDTNEDIDQDGLTNLQEYQFHTNPQDSDSDGDGLEDGIEVSMGLDPSDSDTDEDGLSDGWEIENGFNPNLNDSYGVGVYDGLQDPDHDGISNYMELLLYLDPFSYNELPEHEIWATGETGLSFYSPPQPCGW